MLLKKMIKLKLDEITDTQSMVLFNTDNLLEMFANVIRLYAVPNKSAITLN